MTINFANNNSLANITALPASVSGGALTLVSSQTASASASLEFSMDSTYDSYVFKFIDIHPANDGVKFQFNGSIDSGSNYNVTKTTTGFRASHNEADTSTDLSYLSSYDLAQSTAFQDLNASLGNGNDECLIGYLQIFSPSSNTFVKHFINRTSEYYSGDEILDYYFAGYFNTTSPVTNLKFQMSSGNIDDGIIKMYGVA
jgi:hypothetical protein